MGNVFIDVLCVLLFLVVSSRGVSVHECNPFLSITQELTGFQIHGQPEWNVTVTNLCACFQQQVQITCPGIGNSTLALDAKIIAQSGNDICTLNGSLFIQPHSSVSFKYAWQEINFQPFDSSEACSIH
ncbi:hypothetical protein DM860_011207 [Cuscuta australis]|uniref:Uncharacterized protein n=1 Tax=Cuscuta australis TaxID=267555 RepID=A0A328DSV1_9ASTE|nr:hypothetical protein DM860_011207 [Cuscuta australis]